MCFVISEKRKKEMYFFLFFYTGAYKAGSVLVKHCSHRFMPSSHLHKAFSVYLYVPIPTLQVSKGSLLIQHIVNCSHVHTKGTKLMWKTLSGKTLAYWKWHLLLVGTSLLHKQIQFVFINNTLIALSWTPTDFDLLKSVQGSLQREKKKWHKY